MLRIIEYPGTPSCLLLLIRSFYARKPFASTPHEPCPKPPRLRGGGVLMNGSSRSCEKMTVGKLCAELQVSLSALQDWRQKGQAPRWVNLSNAILRILRNHLENWPTDCQCRA